MEAPSEAQLSRSTGGWITFPFIIASSVGLTLAFGGWQSNLIVYLIEEFEVESIDAAQISNLVNGAGSLIPVLAAIVADSFLGCFSTIWICSIISLLGTILLALTATLDTLRPKPCEVDSTSCIPKPRIQYVVLYAAIVLATLGSGGTRSTLSTIGADQLNKPKEQGIFFNWFFFFWYSASVVASTAIVYVEDNVSWKVGFFICAAANVVASVIFLMGTRFYTKFKPEGSPFTSLARVVVASIRKRKMPLPLTGDDFYHGRSGVEPKAILFAPSKTFRFLNRAAIKSEGDINPDGSTTNRWRLCSVQEVEDFKSLIKIVPLWSSSFFLGTTIGVQASLSVLQALAMERHVGQHFQIPAGSVLVFVLISTAIFLALFDKFLFPTWKNLTGKSLTPLQRIGVGHVLNFLSMGVSALVESKRLKLAKSNHLDQGSIIVHMSVLWLVPQLALVGIAEAFHYPGQVSLYYQEFPITLKNMATAMISVLVGIAFYLATALVDVVRKATTWLPGNINNGRLDNVYWLLVVGSALNFGYYVTCAWYYKYQNLKEVDHNGSTSDE
ncbi:protein NRT1/ PTR FAMILY 2.7-like [Lycium barbarum]|uniref:protein NRT1/ PTR FAMILY 2.7-like n=1 Tax=Lycium barbarum TaxID=112863 RepID=UPI00293E2B63|nr:protein NRT1/ PTR FAMILY 2.7-like [Lycium barbarum]